MRSLLVLLLLAAPAFSQTAVVIPVDAKDATELSKLADAVTAAQAAFDVKKHSIEGKYLQVDEGDPDAGDCVSSITSSTNSGSIELTIENGHIYSGSTIIDTEPVAKMATPLRVWRRGFGCGRYNFSRNYSYIVPLSTYNAAPVCSSGYFTTAPRTLEYSPCPSGIWIGGSCER